MVSPIGAIIVSARMAAENLSSRSTEEELRSYLAFPALSPYLHDHHVLSGEKDRQGNEFEEDSRRKRRAFEKLYRILRIIDGLPLSVTGITGVSPLIRGTEVGVKYVFKGPLGWCNGKHLLFFGAA